ncbi:hypothetical protein XMV225_003129 [Aliiroseovarius sp. xm-v-225]|jgi:hypothetical protein|uniref:hypothetical protein n=1 Tax=unclassified Aliiroseovarius TaxID=2623558 RepID=UPI0015689081|nr:MULTISPECIES: hypothetical protein [unclassified Aliiroseovarius]NRP45939.1 hypothetical protein [Aliiroseovarius sp. xm-m-378]NRP66807.1 hypothetical protein [Aliiroseovarius sp. xm-v-225]NRP93871.1 hypothetical protein [Aliiroseovarius sp. xm-a-134]
MSDQLPNEISKFEDPIQNNDTQQDQLAHRCMRYFGERRLMIDLILLDGAERLVELSSELDNDELIDLAKDLRKAWAYYTTLNDFKA